jgi:hypothetical protein
LRHNSQIGICRNVGNKFEDGFHKRRKVQEKKCTQP